MISTAREGRMGREVLAEGDGGGEGGVASRLTIVTGAGVTANCGKRVMMMDS
jgi:hypothetical protein